jgi:hypothetical protein
MAENSPRHRLDHALRGHLQATEELFEARPGIPALIRASTTAEFLGKVSLTWLRFARRGEP